MKTTPPALSEDAKTLLIEAAHKSSSGIVKTRGSLQTNGREFVEEDDPRSEARWKAALEELIKSGLVDDESHQGEEFGVTDFGYRVADILRAQG